MKPECGDLPIAYTDGRRFVRLSGRTPPRETLEYIVRSADAFVAGTPQYDDMTLIVARVG